ncbi:MAG: allantoinase [Catenulispora sp. 13_1_20CM_3_70_7]|nr:allantoinase AllB [Catenulisporales bacterium]OLE27694.1 MAG: allantoinase [Catenulispora sp. 13_1_20CM_3_70_7]
MTAFDLVLRSRRTVLPEGTGPAAVCVTDSRISAVLPYDAPVDGVEEWDLGGLALLPGLVDTHVHVNEPGRTAWEGFASATRAAALGGVTTLIDMPLNAIPPTTTPAALAAKRAAAQGQCHVDVGFWGGAVPGNADDLAPLHEAGVFGFKCFLADSGVPEFPALDSAQLEAAARRIAAFDGLLIVHAEDPGLLAGHQAGTGFGDFVASRPDAAETSAVATVLDAARRSGARVHILHLSSAEPLPLIAAAKADGVRVSVETCPHYLVFDAEHVPDGATEFKCCPPIRSGANAERLWAALASGLIDFVVSDHSPCTPDLKAPGTGDFAAAWGGIASIQLGLSAVWTEARDRGWSLDRVVDRMARRTADFVGLSHKGRIAEGCDADLVVFDPEAVFRVDAEALAHRNPVTPYHGRELTGVVRATFLRGVELGVTPHGSLLRRSAATRAAALS